MREMWMSAKVRMFLVDAALQKAQWCCSNHDDDDDGADDKDDGGGGWGGSAPLILVVRQRGLADNGPL